MKPPFLSLLLASAAAATTPRLSFEGAAISGNTVTYPSGSRLSLSVANVPKETRLVILDLPSRMRWYDGGAETCAVSRVNLRPATNRLALVFIYPDQTQTNIFCSVVVTNQARGFAPGLAMRIIRYAKPGFPSEAAFAPQGPALANDILAKEVYRSYPAYRTAESAQPGMPGTYRLPDYWIRPIASLSFDADLSTMPNDLLAPGLRSAARVDGFLACNPPGPVKIRAVSTFPFRLQVAGRSVECVPPTVPAHSKIKKPPTVGLQEIGFYQGTEPVPFNLTLLSGSECTGGQSFRLLWQKPGGKQWEPFPAGAFLHEADPAREAAYAAFTDAHANRSLVLTGHVQKAVLPEAGSIAKQSGEAYARWIEQALEVFRQTRRAADADAILSSLEARLAVMIATSTDTVHIPAKENHHHPRGYDGATMRLLLSVRPFIETCLTNPALQRHALAARAAMLAYADGCFARAFLNEINNGTNDGYGDDNNFLVNVWRSAELWDNPLAYDAARSLYDSHFAYVPGDACGLESDGTFSFHNANGRQLNIGAYGADWCTRVLKPIHLGTPWGDTHEQYRRLAAFAQAGEWFFYKGAMAFSANGRHNTHVGIYSPLFVQRLLALPPEALDGENRAALEAQLRRLEGDRVLAGNRFFFRQLIAVHRRADYYLDVKMSSPLVGGVETFAGENPGNLSFGDGVTTLLRHGDEYRDIHRYNIPDSLWRFRSLPGTTELNEEWGTAVRPAILEAYRRGKGTRAGGVSDGMLGHCAFEFVSHPRNATQARKLFAFTEEGLFVLGGGINGSRPATAPFTYRSTLNQTVFAAPAQVLSGDRKINLGIPATETDKLLSFPLDQKFWITHNGIGYLVLPPPPGAPRQTLNLRVSVRTPLNRLPYAAINNDSAPGMEAYRKTCQQLTAQRRKVTVLEIWIDYGEKCIEQTAAYYVCMRPEKHPEGRLLDEPPVDLAANSKTCQAVYDRASDVIHAFFYKPGSVTVNGVSVGVDKPASVMLRKGKDGGWQTFIEDPVAACTTQLGEMADVINLQVGSARQSVKMPGAGLPDDRLRGAIQHF